MPKKMPTRMCVSCREMKIKKELIRIVISKDGDISLDPSGKKPGRGAYICRNRKCLENAVKGHRLDRGLKAQADQSIVTQLLKEMEGIPVE